MRLGSHLTARGERAKAQCIELLGPEQAERRRQQIAALPSKLWRGVQVYEVTCHGDFGRGPHQMFVPEYVLWSLIDLRAFVCPFHK
jgi:hypothetical protein